MCDQFPAELHVDFANVVSGRERVIPDGQVSGERFVAENDRPADGAITEELHTVSRGAAGEQGPG